MQLTYYENRFWIDMGNYNPVYVNKIKLIAGCRWNGKLWSIPASMNSYNQVHDIFELYDDNSMTKFFSVFSKIENEMIPENWFAKLKTQCYEHQKEGVKFLASRQYGALLFEMGTGKTKILIDLITYKGWQEILVVCPLSVVSVWKNEIGKHSDYKAIELNSSKQKKLKTLSEENNGIYIINYESIDTILSTLILKQFDVIIADESTKIKNPHSKRSKALYKLAKTLHYKYIATGTPIINNLIDWFGQSKFLNPSLLGSSLIAFRTHYCRMGGFEFKEIIDYQNIEELQQIIGLCSMRVLKKDCLDLPEKVYEVREIKMGVIQSKLYKEMKNLFITQIARETFTASNVLAKIIKLQEIAGGQLEKIEFGENAKLSELMDIMQEIGKESVVIWCRFDKELEMIERELLKQNITCAKFYGATTSKQREEILQAFQEKKIQVFIGQIQTGGLGITLTASSTVIFYSNTFSYGERAQAEDRNHRIGQKKSVVYIDLVCEKTIDSKILKALKKKQNVADMIIDNKETLEFMEVKE